jgi:hypothetical protein
MSLSANGSGRRTGGILADCLGSRGLFFEFGVLKDLVVASARKRMLLVGNFWAVVAGLAKLCV